MPPGDLKTVAIIVNYKSARLTLRAVESVLQSESLGLVHVVVVDNSEDENEAARLLLGLPHAVTLFVNGENTGFGRACNLAFEQFPEELILLINPDARLLPGCLLRLQRTLCSAEKAAAVGPQVFWEEEQTFLLPPSYPPFLFCFDSVLSERGAHAEVNRLISAMWRWYQIRVWHSAKAVAVSNLSGGHVLLKRDAVKKAGGLFDPRFFLYFEDTDLFVRLRKAGYRLFAEPRAKAIHFYDQCGTENPKTKKALQRKARRIFLDKNCQGWKSHAAQILNRLSKSFPPDGVQAQYQRFSAPFVLNVPRHLQRGWLFEWSPNANLIPSVGRFGQGSCMNFSDDCWAMLAPGEYFGRLGGQGRFGRLACLIYWVVE